MASAPTTPPGCPLLRAHRAVLQSVGGAALEHVEVVLRCGESHSAASPEHLRGEGRAQTSHYPYEPEREGTAAKDKGLRRRVEAWSKQRGAGVSQVTSGCMYSSNNIYIYIKKTAFAFAPFHHKGQCEHSLTKQTGAAKGESTTDCEPGLQRANQRYGCPYSRGPHEPYLVQQRHQVGTNDESA